VARTKTGSPSARARSQRQARSTSIPAFDAAQSLPGAAWRSNTWSTMKERLESGTVARFGMSESTGIRPAPAGRQASAKVASITVR